MPKVNSLPPGRFEKRRIRRYIINHKTTYIPQCQVRPNLHGPLSPGLKVLFAIWSFVYRLYYKKRKRKDYYMRQKVVNTF